MTKVGRPKKGEWEVKRVTYCLYDKDIKEIKQLKNIWNIYEVDVIRRAILICLQNEIKKSKEKS